MSKVEETLEDVAKDIRPGSVSKVITIGEDGEKTAEFSQQMIADPFITAYRHSGLLEPPFSLEQLVNLAEKHPTHSSALEQKSADIVGTGWEWVRGKEIDNAADQEKLKKERDELDNWFKSLGDGGTSDETTHEVLLRAFNDVETLGQGCIELARDPGGKLRYWYSMPAHTVRFHRDNIRMAQIKNEKRHWFKRWYPNDDTEVDRVTGKVYEKGGCPPGRRANEIFVIRRPSRRSSFYGQPLYVSATGWIMLSIAARDDNIFFFENRREPRWAIILENVEDDPEIENRLRRALQVDLKKPHQNLLIPLSGPAKITFQKLGENNGDMSWMNLQDRADAAILIAHRIPGERLGLVRVGALGGSVVADTSRVYKESLVQTSQTLLAIRINKLLQEEGPQRKPSWDWRPEKLDLTEEEAVQDNASRGFTAGIFNLNEARERVGEEPLPPDDDRGGKFLWELNPQAQAAAQAAGGAPGDAGSMQGAQDRLSQQLDDLLNGPVTGPESTTTAPRRDGGYGGA